MSARSPRSSLSGASSAEVADDFGESLKDLQINNRYEISNLTIIAKENTEHAQAISKVLESHIKSTAPMRKLPALYVLDSIVKNVGTPYTVYLGRSLYSTFMEAYTLVDSNTRRNMEGMLKTWKDPVPGSMDPRPVFPPETVRPIENALIKAKTAALQSNRNQQAQNQRAEYRNTPTPPQHNGRFGAPPPSQNTLQPHYGYGVQQQPTPQPFQQTVSTPTLSSTPAQPQSYPYAAPFSQPVNEVDAIKRDVGGLTSRLQAQFGANPFDQGLQQQLKALLQLQNVLNTQALRSDELQAIRAQVAGLSAAPATPQPQSLSRPNPPTPVQWQPQASFTGPPQVAQSSAPYTLPSWTQPQQPAALLAPGALNGLQALLTNGQKPGTPQMRAAAPALQHASHTQLSQVQDQTSSSPALNGSDLIASLTKSGLLPKLPPAPPIPQAMPPVTASSTQSTEALLKSLQGILPSIASQTSTPTMAPAQLANTGKLRIPMDASSLKTFRPELVSALYDAWPNQCGTCGRRFLATEEGRNQKARHLDWHFRTNQRMADPNVSRGAHRDWFPTELAWIQLVDFDPSTATAEESDSPKKQVKKVEEQFVRAPAGVTKSTCSICYEEMKSSYSEELQDWIFVNATMYQGKIVHASCLAEMQKGQQTSSLATALATAGGGSRQRSATPDSSLGKRKADGSLAGASGRLKTDS